MASLSYFITKLAGRAPKKPLESTHNTPSPTVKLFLGDKAKKSFLYGLLAGSAISAYMLPLLVSASFLSGILSGSASQTSAASFGLNSQTIQLLSPALNINPNRSVGGGDITVVGSSALVPQEGPSGTAADIINRPATSQISVYVVRDGDTLSEIANMFDVSVNTIVWANDIRSGIIHPGDTLIILPITGIQHAVVSGETLASLAKKFNSNIHDIAQYNDLADSAALTAGSIVIIPNGEIATAVSQGAAKPRAKATAKEPYLGGSGPEIDGYYSWPIVGGIITQGLHGWNAVDIGAPRGTDVLASAGGLVIVARQGGAWNGGYGNYVVVAHSNGTQTLYSHMSRVLVGAGEQVEQGDILGKVGSTGLSTGAHLHFEVRGAINPLASLPLGATQ